MNDASWNTYTVTRAINEGRNRLGSSNLVDNPNFYALSRPLGVSKGLQVTYTPEI